MDRPVKLPLNGSLILPKNPVGIVSPHALGARLLQRTLKIREPLLMRPGDETPRPRDEVEVDVVDHRFQRPRTTSRAPRTHRVRNRPGFRDCKRHENPTIDAHALHPANSANEK